MKNALQYYYHITTDDIHQIDGIYKFTFQNQYYALYPFEGDLNYIDKIYQFSLMLLRQGVYCHQIMPNSNQQLITYIYQIPYVLLRSNYPMEEKITAEHVIEFSNITNNITYQGDLRHDNWEKLWSNKIDYFEYQVNQFGKEYPIIRESFGYFVGMAETGISLLNQMNLEYKNLVVAHRRIKRNQTVFDLYNPLFLIIDFKIRDICEYFKESFIHNEDIWEDIQYYLTHNALTSYEYLMFLIRMFYPTFYFDTFENIIEHNSNEKLLLPIIGLVDKYEQLLKKIYVYISQFVVVPEIDWIKKI